MQEDNSYHIGADRCRICCVALESGEARAHFKGKGHKDRGLAFMRYDQGLRNASRAYGELQEWRARLVKQRASKADDAIDTKLALAESHAETSKRISAALRGNGDWKEISLDTADVTAFCQSTKAWFAEIAPDAADVGSDRVAPLREIHSRTHSMPCSREGSILPSFAP